MTSTGAAANTVFTAGSDELGVFARVSIDPNVFSDVAIFKAAYWFTDTFYLYFARHDANKSLSVEFRLKHGDDPEELKAACGEFSNKLLDYELRQKILAETAGIRDTLVRKAFFEAKAPLPAFAVSNESSLSSPVLQQPAA